MIASLIPARGGSKGVPRKNIRPLGGKPLILYTIEAALNSATSARVFVSTEDSEIAAVSEGNGAHIISRPQELALDETPSFPVIMHALPLMEAALGTKIEILVLLQATTPFRNAADIDATVRLLQKTGADSAVSVVKINHFHPMKIKRLADGRLLPFSETEPEGIRRQDLPEAYIRNGGIYAARRETLISLGSLYGNDCRAHVMPEERSMEIDSLRDFSFAEWQWAQNQTELE